MSLDLTPGASTAEARRQSEICNACRYCEGYCDVFPAMFAERSFADADITQLAHLCHNCRGCYYACQYTAPHEFDLNLPRALAEVRANDWERFAWPAGFARAFQRHGMALAAALVGAVVAIVALGAAIPGNGSGFYAVLPHAAMVAIFLPAFVCPLVSVAVSMRRYWKAVDGRWVRWMHITRALERAASLRNLSGGQGQGCNFEKGDRYSPARRRAHQATMWGFVLCFGSTASGTILHYGYGAEAPYGFWSLPKLLGVPGGIILTVGAFGLAWLKTQADRDLGAPLHWGGEMAFVLLLGLTGLSGLLLYAATGTAAVPALLALHLGAVLVVFLTLPYSKMVHAFYRFAALVRDAQR